MYFEKCARNSLESDNRFLGQYPRRGDLFTRVGEYRYSSFSRRGRQPYPLVPESFSVISIFQISISKFPSTSPFFACARTRTD